MIPKNILFITRTASGGVAVVLERIVRGIDKQRYIPIVFFDTNQNSYVREMLKESNVKIIGYNNKISKKVYNYKKKKNKNIKNRLTLIWGESLSQTYLSIKRFYEFLKHQLPKIKIFVKVIRENDVNILHTHSEVIHGKAEIIAAALCGVPCVVHVHGYPQLSFFDKIFNIFVDKFIFISKDVKKKYLKHNKNIKNAFVIYNGVYIEDFTKPYNSMKVKRVLGIREYEITVCIVGRISWWKGHEYFIDAIGIVKNKFPEIKGIIIGDINEDKYGMNLKYYEMLNKLVKDLDLTNNIIFTGYRSDINNILNAMDIIVHASSIPEPFGLVIIESMAAKKPVIATKAGGVVEIVCDGINGILVPTKDSNAIANAIIEIVANKEKAKLLGFNAQRHIIKNFTVEKQIDKIQRLYDSII